MEQRLAAQALPARTPKANAWVRVLLTGFLLYVVAFVFLLLTGNPNLFPTLVLIGSFLVPVTYVTFIYERSQFNSLSPFTVAVAFVYGGILGVLAASLLEPIFIRHLSFSS